MKDDRKTVTVKLTEAQDAAVERWMTEGSCSRQVALVGLLVQGAKSMGVWSDEPRARPSRFARNELNNIRYGDNTTVSVTEGSIGVVPSKNNVANEVNKVVQSKVGLAFSEFWYSIPNKRGLKEEAWRKWSSKKVQEEFGRTGLAPADVADRYVRYYNSTKGKGYDGAKFVKHVSNWLDAFGFHDDSGAPEKEFVDVDLTGGES